MGKPTIRTQIRTQTKTIRVGVSQLAAEMGVAPNTIQWHLNRGRSTADIRRHYRDKKYVKGQKWESQSSVVKLKRKRQENAADALAAQLAEKLAVAAEDAESGAPQGESEAQARKRRLIALADAQEIANAQKRGELVEVARVEAWGIGVVKTTVDLITRVPGQIQDRIAAEVDAAKCGAIMLEELARVVAEIQKMEALWITK
jgi:phage terminase Nu1 subunit (DNA packaging protein)